MAKTEMKPTKEEILAKHGYKCAIDVKDKDKFIEAFVNPLLEAMQEYAEQFHKEKLREELKLFNDWMCSKQYDGLIPTIEQCINDYLNTLNTK
jgi:predicted house-cleaning noncanonical NTP pyrophosphatase (MazG superfamily)